LCKRWPEAAPLLQIPCSLAVAQVVWLLVENPSVRLSRRTAKVLIDGRARLAGALRRRSAAPDRPSQSVAAGQNSS